MKGKAYKKQKLASETYTEKQSKKAQNKKV